MAEPIQIVRSGVAVEAEYKDGKLTIKVLQVNEAE